MSSDFNPNSPDAVFSRILQRLEEQDRAAATQHTQFLGVLGEIRDEVKKTNGRVTGLERWRTEVKSQVALLATVVSVAGTGLGWALEHFLLK